MSDACIIVFPPKDEASSAIWMSVRDGKHVRRALSLDRLDVGLHEADSITLALPVAAVTIRTFELPDMAAAQGSAVARRALLDLLLDADEDMHVVVSAPQEGQHRHVVAAVSRQTMESALAWAASQGLDPEIVVPAGLLLPEVPEGFIRAIVGREIIARGNGTCLPGGGPIADAVMDGSLVIGLEPHEVQAAIAAAAVRPVLNLRAGPFARRMGGALPQRRLRRWALMAYAAVFLALLTALTDIGRTWLAVRELDGQSLALARQIVPSASDAAEAEQQLDARLARSGAQSRSFTGLLAGLSQAMRNAPAVSLTLLSRTSDGLLQATLAAPRAEDINAVSSSLQAKGFGVTATLSAEPSGSVAAQITVAG